MGHLGGQCRGLFGSQRREWKLHDLSGLAQIAQQGRERVSAAGLFGPHRADHQDSWGGIAAKQGMQPFERVGIAPLQVVDQQEQRPARLVEGRVQGGVEVAALPALGQGMRPLD